MKRLSRKIAFACVLTITAGSLLLLTQTDRAGGDSVKAQTSARQKVQTLKPTCLSSDPSPVNGEIRQEYYDGAFYVFLKANDKNPDTWGQLQCMGPEGPNDKWCQSALREGVKHQCNLLKWTVIESPASKPQP